jgi:hypothetical protein
MPEPGLRPSTGITRLLRYHEPLRLPQRPKADPFRSPGWWTRPTTAVDLARCLEDLVRMLTPLPRLERTSSQVGCSLILRRPSPSGRRVGSSEELSRPAQGSTSFQPAHLHLGCSKDFPGGFSGRSLASTAPVATGRTDNSPDGTYTRWPSRPRRSLRSLKSAHVRSPFVPHCQRSSEARSRGRGGRWRGGTRRCARGCPRLRVESAAGAVAVGRGSRCCRRLSP